MKRRWIAVVCVTSLLPLACSSADPAPAPAPGVPSDEVHFASTDVEIAPGAEKYLCWAGNLPADRQVVIKEIIADYGPGTHHIFFGWTLAPEPEGMHECPVLFKTTWIPIYLGGVETSSLKLPEGAAIDMGTGKQLVLQLHLQNASPAPITNRVTMKMKVTEPQQEYVPAGIFGLDNRVIAIPPNSTGTRTSMSCKATKDMNVFSVFGHMHKLGQDFQVSLNGQVVVDEAFNFDNQPATPVDFRIATGDEIGLSCTHRNPNEKAFGYGESSDTEMCATIFYHTPYDGLGGCINAPTE